MKRLYITILAAACGLLTACAPSPVSSPGFKGIVGDIDSTPGEVKRFKDSKTVSIGAGWVKVGSNSYWNAWYIVDETTQSCWYKVGAQLEPLDCCKLKNVKNALPHLNFLTSNDCGQLKL